MVITKILAGILIVLAILISGCVSTVNPVDPKDITVNVMPVTMKEFREEEIAVNVLNNATLSIDSVKATSFDPFNIVESTELNIPPRTQEAQSSASINVKIQAPSFKTDTSNSTLILSYASGKNDKGESITKTKSVTVQATVLPDAVLQFVGFAKGLGNLTEAASTSTEIGKGENATITFSVKNEGETTIDENTLSVLVDVKNKRIGGNKTIIISEAMAKSGTSHTKGIQVPVLENAPNGETDVVVTLLMGNNVIDSKTLQLKVTLT